MTIPSLSLVMFMLVGLSFWKGGALQKPAVASLLMVILFAVSGLWDRFALPGLRLQWESVEARSARLSDERKMKRARAAAAPRATGAPPQPASDVQAGKSESPTGADPKPVP